MPVERIMSLEDRFPELGIQVVSKEKRKEMDEFLDSMNGMRLHEVKQKLGEFRLSFCPRRSGCDGV
jgi:hypothetical protein